jgi:arsenate reductase
MSCSSALATQRARSSRKASFARRAEGASTPIRREPSQGAVNPFALKVLDTYGYPTHGFRSKNWNEFARPEAPNLDFVFTVCDSAAGEACPVWPGQPMTAHWGIEDPAAVEGTDIQKEAAFVTAFKCLRNRISIFISLPLPTLDRMSLRARLREIGRMEGATEIALKSTT